MLICGFNKQNIQPLKYLDISFFLIQHWLKPQKPA